MFSHFFHFTRRLTNFFLFIFIWLAAVSPISRFFHNVQCHSNSGELAESFLRPTDCFWISITNPESMTKRLNRWKGLDRWKFLSDHNSTRLKWQWRSLINIWQQFGLLIANQYLDAIFMFISVSQRWWLSINVIWLFSLKWAYLVTVVLVGFKVRPAKESPCKIFIVIFRVMWPDVAYELCSRGSYPIT